MLGKGLNEAGRLSPYRFEKWIRDPLAGLQPPDHQDQDRSGECEDVGVVVHLQAHVEDREELVAKKDGVTEDDDTQGKVHYRYDRRQPRVLEIRPHSVAPEDGESVDKGEPCDYPDLRVLDAGGTDVCTRIQDQASNIGDDTRKEEKDEVEPRSRPHQFLILHEVREKPHVKKYAQNQDADGEG